MKLTDMPWWLFVLFVLAAALLVFLPNLPHLVGWVLGAVLIFGFAGYFILKYLKKPI